MADLIHIKKRDPNSRASKIVRLLSSGYSAQTILDKLAPEGHPKRESVRVQIYRLAGEDEVQLALGGAAKGALIQGVLPAAEALARRASKGNVPAAKLLFEATGFHNPRVEHKHSGNIQIELKGVNRPPIETDSAEADIVDADVVD